MNQLRRRNQQMVAIALRKPLLTKSIDVRGGLVNVQTTSWEEYWDGCTALDERLSILRAAWIALLEDWLSASRQTGFVHAYFTLLRFCLEAYRAGAVDLPALTKVVGFETFRISCEYGPLAAGIFNVRNPVYLLSRIALPQAPENPKFVPLICPSGGSAEVPGLFCHYRRIGIRASHPANLFVYPPTEARYRSSSYWLIAELFEALTPKTDPWVHLRTRLLFDGVFSEMVASLAQSRVRLLDVACGSAQTTLGLCRKANARRGTSFDLTLVDVVRTATSIPKAFYRHSRVFNKLFFRHENLFDWVDKASADAAPHFDIAVMLRVCDVFSRFQIEEVSWHQAAALLHRDRAGVRLHRDVTHPARLLEGNRLDGIQQRLWRSAFRSGTLFHQFSLSDYFKAMHLAMRGEVSHADDSIHVPIRRFDESALVLASGRSLIGALMELADRLIVEDSDLSARLLARHIAQFGLKGLDVIDLTHRRGGRGASVAVIRRRGISGPITANSPATSTCPETQEHEVTQQEHS